MINLPHPLDVVNHELPSVCLQAYNLLNPCDVCGNPATLEIDVRADGRSTRLCSFCHHAYRTMRISQIAKMIGKIFAGDVEVVNA